MKGTASSMLQTQRINEKIYKILLWVFIFIFFLYPLLNFLSFYNFFDKTKIYLADFEIKDIKNYIFYANTIAAVVTLIVSLSIFISSVFIILNDKNTYQNYTSNKYKLYKSALINFLFIFSIFFMIAGLSWSPLFIFSFFIWVALIEYHVINFIFSYHAQHPAFYFLATYLPATFVVQLIMCVKIRNYRITRVGTIIYGIIYFFVFSSFITNLIWIGQNFWGIKHLKIYN